MAAVLKDATERLERAGVPEARVEAEWLLARALGTDRGGLLVQRAEALAAPVAAMFESWIARRARREPAQHILGTQEFHGLEFLVDGRVLIPRPETEDLVDAALALDVPQDARAADLGTGSGCLAVTLAVRRPDLRLFALDRSPAALDVARANAAHHGVEARIHFARGDFAVPPTEWRGTMSLVVSNPPYVTEAEWSTLEPEVRDHDPREALVAGPTGLEAYAALVPAAAALLVPGGHLLVELGQGQAEAVRRLLGPSDWTILGVRPDMQGIPRVLVARRSPGGS